MAGVKIEFRKLLLQISRDLKPKEVKELKYLVDIEAEKCDEMSEAFQVFKHLQDEEKLSPTNFTVVKELLDSVGRVDLVSRVSEKEDYFAQLYVEEIKTDGEQNGSHFKVTSPLHIDICSQAFDDPGLKTRGGISSIKITGTDCSLHKRGMNVVVLDRKTGIKIAVKSYDTHFSKNEAQSAYYYLKSLTGDKIVLIAIQDDAWDEGRHFPIELELERLGASSPVLKVFRSSLALIGYAGPWNPGWVTFAQNEPGYGPTSITADISLTKEHLPLPESPEGYASLPPMPPSIPGKECSDPGIQQQDVHRPVSTSSKPTENAYDEKK